MPLPPADDRRTTLTFTHGGGRFANQLMVFGHLIGLVEEHPEFRVENMAFWRFAELCAGTEHNPRCLYPTPHGAAGGLWPRTLLRLAKVTPAQLNRGVRVLGPPALHKLLPWRSLAVPDGEEWRLGSEEFLRRVSGLHRVLLSGWRLRDWALFAKHQDAIRAFLRPASRFYRVAEPHIAGLRQKHRTLVGVLIRQTDYRLWKGGRFFLTSEQYRTCLERLRTRFGEGVGFVVAADEAQSTDVFDGLPVAWCTGQAVGAGHYLESFAELSLCDYIVSVPSTFSAWAAFFGRKPLLPIAQPDDPGLAERPPLANNLLDAHRDPWLSAAVN